ncbi:hypothetical protein DSO57_1032346 [Entomophthora muscae]|uniref:Uncharacterized protein n=1 Tax=Entomophthora muscae TaxID=34485 RepID=A0ACC2SQ18_9FUNG|nr:hypothetical protein DSO57_1032346 [Entomophthora muscae]
MSKTNEPEGIKSDGRSVDHSRVMMTKVILPNHSDTRGYVFGGQILSWIDVVASIAARRHSETSCVTRSVDAVHFLRPIHVGDIVVLKANVNRSWKTSMEVGVRVEREIPFTGKREFCCHAYLTFIALRVNKDSTCPTVVPKVIPASPAEIRRFEAAEGRRQSRFSQAQQPDSMQQLREKIQKLNAFDPVYESLELYGTDEKAMLSSYGEMIELVLPQHANTLQITFGGQIMEWMEYCAVICALRLSRSYILTAGVDSLQFHRPTYVGNVITIRGVVTKTYKSSMEVYITVSAEDIKTGKIEFTNDGFFTVAAVTDDDQPAHVSSVAPSDEAESSAQFGSEVRRNDRLVERRRLQSFSKCSMSSINLPQFTPPELTPKSSNSIPKRS